MHGAQLLVTFVMQSQVFLKYTPAVIGAACFALAMHSLGFALPLWRARFKNVVDEAVLPHQTVYQCMIDL